MKKSESWKAGNIYKRDYILHFLVLILFKIFYGIFKLKEETSYVLRVEHFQKNFNAEIEKKKIIKEMWSGRKQNNDV